ncbi:cob(I)yrinic acid a,c-diamide adenosyltransferase [Alphaproteobacteria bacterium]|nr:cob(I)yrinic acid a,c-diamide adenosyltransferase [Alphaproteobacteria bacterium]
MNNKYANLSEAEKTERHNQKMTRKDNARDKMLARKTKEKGLIMVHTGKGKGKTTAAMGLAIRAIGNDMKIGIIQFVKGVWSTGETKVLNSFPELCTIKAMGEGFTWKTQNRDRDVELANIAWIEAKSLINNPEIKMVILDEINIVLKYDYIDLEDVKNTLKNKREDLHIVLTGRKAHDDIIALSDLTTEMEMIKHHFQADVKAQLGIEY